MRTCVHPAFVFNRKSLIVLTIAILFASATALWRIRNQAERRLAAERALLARQNLGDDEFNPVDAANEVDDDHRDLYR